MVHVYNLNILILDDFGNVTRDDTLYRNIRNQLTLDNCHTFQVNNEQLNNISIKWEYSPLEGIEKHFMGEFFTVPQQEFDMVMIEHTNITITKIEEDRTLNPNRNKIAFYISKLLATPSND